MTAGINTIAGSQDVDRDYLTRARLLSANRWQVMTKVALPSVLPWILAGMCLSFAYGLAGAVVGEMFLGQPGLGYLIVAGSDVVNTALIFASLMIASLVIVIVIVIVIVTLSLSLSLSRSHSHSWRIRYGPN
jgi:ABC-type nitrate/sulfonate/bicarbonate transport system permease component